MPPASQAAAMPRRYLAPGPLVQRHPVARARISNGTGGAVLPGVDQRSAIARRFRDVVIAIVADIGGVDRCSEAKMHLVRRFAAQVVLAEQMEGQLAAGEEIDIGLHAHISSTLVRLATRIGTKRAMKDITPPSVADYVAHLASTEETPE